MAVSSNSHFSNSAQGSVGVAGDVDIYAAHSTPRFAIGYRVPRADGNEYVYSHFGAATGSGLLCSQDLSESALADTDNAIIAPASAANTNDGTAGSSSIQVTIASVTAGQYAGGYATITDDTGESYTYRIKSNTATDDPASGDVRITFYEKLQAAVDATSDLAICGSLYANLEAATTTDTVASGVSCASMGVGEYGWVQTKGVAGVLQDSTVTLGSGLIIGSVAGSVATAVETDILQRVGTVITAGDDTGYCQACLSL